MISSFLANNPYFWHIMFVVWQTAELGLGLKKPMDAGSIPQLLWRILCTIQLKLTKTKHTEGVPAMTASLNPNTITLQVVVDKPTFEFLGLIISTVKAVSNGQDPKAAMLGALPALVGSLGDLAKIQGDLALDRASVVEAVSQQAGNLLESFVLLKAAAPVVVPK